MVGVAQLVRAPDCGSGGRGFKSHYPPVEPLAQSVEHLTFNQRVLGSSPRWFICKNKASVVFRSLVCVSWLYQDFGAG